MEASALTRQRALLPRSRRLLAALGDDRLVDQARLGNVAAFEVIYDRHYRGILSFCRHMLGSREEAEDAVQQTFASAYTDLQANDRDIRLKAWLYTIARNRCLSTLRARREQAADFADEDLPTAGLSEQVQQRADLQELLRDMRDLPDDQREALVLFEIGDLSQTEVAKVIGVEPVKVKALVFQARSALIENREARAIPCAEIREQLATATGGALRRGPLRRHLKTCEGCSEYRDQVKAQRRALAAILPVVPTVGLKESVLGAIGLGGGGGGAAAGGGLATGAAGVGANAAGGGAGLTGVFASIGGAGAAKLAIGATLGVGSLVGGGVAVERAVSNDGGSDSARAAEAEGKESSGAGNPANGNPGNGSLVGNAGDDPAGDKDDKRRDDRKDDDKKSGDRKDQDDGGTDDDGNAGKGDEKESGRSGDSRRGSRARGRGRGRANGNRGGSGTGTGNRGGTPRGNNGSNGNRGTGNNGNRNGGGIRQPAPVTPEPTGGNGGKKGGRGPVGTPPVPTPATDSTTGSEAGDGGKRLPPVGALPLPE